MIRETDERLAGYLRDSRVAGVLVISDEGRVLSANATAESMLGYGVGELINTSLADLWAANSPHLRNKSEQPRTLDGELRRRNGDLFPATLTLTPLPGSDDADALVAFTSRDDAQHLSAALMHVQRLAGIGTLTASVAHELTNPISIIAGACSSLLDELDTPEPDRAQLDRYVDIIEQSAFRCARIVEVLRNYAHSQSDSGPQIAVTSPQALMDDALALVEQQFRKRGHVEIAYTIQPDLTTIFCDHNRIAQVLVNLLFNARDAMQPNGGDIHVRFWMPELLHDRQLIERYLANYTEWNRDHTAPGELFAFSVSDTGTGIAPGLEERIFESFFTTKPLGQGTGLGLFIARTIVVEHNGIIWGENNPDRGATFTVVMPRRP